MSALHGKPLETLSEDGELILRRGFDADGARVLLLSPRQQHPAAGTLARLQHEYELRDELDPAWAVQPRALLRQGGTTVLVLDDPGGAPLERRLGQALDLGVALPLAVSLAKALGQVHARGLVHKDLCPANVLVQEQQVRLTGFGLASRLPRERQPLVPPEMIVGTLPYLAPEQTGRMNRSVDARSDLYALGVMLYRMLTGELPFNASDAMEWIHCHIARLPRPPAEMRPGLPQPLSDLVMKLLAKTAEDRYQTALGLAADLERCLEEWRAHGRIRPFDLGRRDVSDQLRIPEKLYGREIQVRRLVDVFDRVVSTGMPEIALVSGYSGIGKSAVINEVQRALVPPRALFAAGKFEQYLQGIPYGPLAQALRSLVRQLLCKSDAELDVWRELLQGALGANGRLVVGLVPELERVIGPQPTVREMPPGEAENRFNMVLARFVGVFARREHPLVIFFDDLQWLDPATLRFLQHLLGQPETRYLLVLGAYRDNEVGAAHLLRLTLDAIRKAGIAVEEIVLSPLALEHVNRLLADALQCAETRTARLAQLVVEKTGGNPFFAIQFLSALVDERLIAFDPQAASWTWDLEPIRARDYTDNVVDLMLGKLKRLPRRTQSLLCSLACLGRSAEVGLLALASGRSAHRIDADLWPALQAGHVLSVAGGFRFSHDRVQEAAYGLMPASERTARHLAVGRHLLARLPPEVMAAKLFDVVGQLNRGAELIDDPGERAGLCRLNARAGRRAKAAIAYAAACDHLDKAVALLPADAWDSDYPGTFELYLERAECEYLAGRFQAADELFERVLGAARSSFDWARAGRLRSQLYAMAGRFQEALVLIVDALARLGVSLPDTDDALLAAAAEEIDGIRTRFAGEAIAGLVDLPKASDPQAEMIVGLLADGLLAAYACRPAYFPLLTTKAVSCSLRYGNSEDSCTAYNSCAVVLIAFRWDLQAAFDFSELALALLDRFDSPKARGSVFAGHGGLVLPWRRHIAEGIPLLERGLAALLETGDFRTAGALTILPVWAALERGDSLDNVLEASEKYAAIGRQVHDVFTRETVLLCPRLVASLKGLTRPPECFDGDGFSEAECVERFRQAGWYTGLAYFQVMKLIAAYLYGNYAEALAAADAAEPALSRMRAMQVAASLHFYRLLTLAAAYPEATAEVQRGHAASLAAGLDQLEFWARNCPANFGHRHALVAAEIAGIEGRELDAERLYEQAIRAARDNGFIHHEALANERAARFYRARGFDRIALAYLRDARHGYLRWGALGKAAALEAAWPELACPEPPASTAAIGARLEQFDLATVVKASHAIASEIVLDRLTAILMNIALEHAGADRGLLILSQAGGWRIAAAAVMDQGQPQVSLGCNPPMPADLPLALLHYVTRAQEPVLVDDAARPGLFSHDPYLTGGQAPRAILCLPLVKQGKLVGILYLENKLTPRAFTRKHLAVLELLAAQAAISIENATLYADLHEREARIRRLVDANIIGILFWKRGGEVLVANDAILDMLGYSRQEQDAGRIDWAGRTPPEYEAAEAEASAELRATGNCRPYEKEYLRKDGSRVPVLIGATSFGGGGEEGVAFVLDLTERKRAEAANQARQAAELANRAKSAFLASMSHELRTPLNAVLGYAQLLARDPRLDARQLQRIDTIRHSGEHLLSLINDVLDLAKIEAGKLELHSVATDLTGFLREVVDIVRPQATLKDLGFELSLAPELPQRVSVDAKRLRQVLLNLLGNAIKFTDEGAVGLEVLRLPDRHGDAALRFTVRDSGVGIDAGALERIFQPFEQTGELRRRAAGTGLGLAISRQLVQLMGGEIQVESVPGRGSRFWFDLSVPIAALAGAVTAPRRTIVAYPGPRRRVLVVDDIAANRAMLTELLESLGFVVDEAADGQQALDQARAQRPDLIMLDAMLPVLDGVTATCRLREMPDLREVPIIILSASASGDHRARSLAAGADAFLPKPVEFDRLLELVGTRLGLSWIHAETAAPAVAVEGPLVVPPREEMEALHRLALIGNMREVRRHADRIAGLDGRFVPFANRLRELAAAFEAKAILQLVEKLLAESGSARID